MTAGIRSSCLASDVVCLDLSAGGRGRTDHKGKQRGVGIHVAVVGVAALGDNGVIDANPLAREFRRPRCLSGFAGKTTRKREAEQSAEVLA